MQASVKNWKKPTPRKIKMIGDMCVYTPPHVARVDNDIPVPRRLEGMA